MVVACFFWFFRPSQPTILQLPRLFTKEVAEATAAQAAQAAVARAAEPPAAPPGLEGEEIKKLAEGAAGRWGQPADEACRQGGTGWYQQLTITEKAGEMERKTNLTLPFYVWVGGGGFDHLAKCARGGNGCCVFVFVRDERPPLPAQKLFPPQALLCR